MKIECWVLKRSSGANGSEEWNRPKATSTRGHWPPQKWAGLPRPTTVATTISSSEPAPWVGGMALQDLTHLKTTGANWATAPDAPESAPNLIDPATLPATSLVDLAIPATEFDGGEYLTLQSVPANAWLLLAVHDGSSEARAAATNRGVRSNAAGEAPLSVPTGLAAGEYVVTVQDPEGVLIGFAALAIAEEVLPTEEPPDDPTTDPTTEPTATATTTAPVVTDPATDSTTSAAPTQGTASPTAPSNGTNQDDLAATGASSTLMIGGAAFALIAGLVIVAESRRRSSQH